MQILLSCTKTMTDSSSVQTPQPTIPRFANEAATLAGELATLSTDELMGLLGVNRQIATLNRQRFSRFHGESAIPALLAYSGIAYKHLDPGSFTAGDYDYAQQHLNITSFLYGLLRPLDAIRNYRLEGSAILPGHGDETMFEFWQGRLTEVFIAKIKADDGILVNLASGEMKRLFDWRRLSREVRVISPEFRTWNGDRLKTIVVYTKMCRGAMARFIIRNRIADTEMLKSFEGEGFEIDDQRSKGDKWLFTV